MQNNTNHAKLNEISPKSSPDLGENDGEIISQRELAGSPGSNAPRWNLRTGIIELIIRIY